MSQNLLQNLNDEQLKAVTHTNGPLMIIAGAGTGKTTVVTQRIAWLIEQGKAKSDEILALTFTDKAAGEMEERVDQLLPIGYLDLWISTFHAFCERVLRQYALEIGIPHQFQLLTEIDAMLLVLRNFDRFELNYYRPRANPTRFIRALLSHVSRLKDETITPEEYLAYAESLQMNQDSTERVATEENTEALSEIMRVQELANAYHVYQQILLENNAFDFSDLISYTIELFKKRPNILKQYKDQFKYILVDEFQDTNYAQYQLVKMLVNKNQNITVVGDDDQSIYKFRGASLSNIMNFRKDFPNATKVILNKNYRSGKNILEGAYALIQQNNPNRLEAQEQLDKRLHAHIEDDGFIHHIHCNTVDEEVAEVVRHILERRTEGVSWSDFAILSRANESAKPFSEALEKAGIPYRFLAMSGLYTKPIILDILAYMRIIEQPHESPSMYRVISHVRLGLKETDVAQLTLYARKKALSLFDAMRHAPLITEMSQEGQQRIQEILTLRSDIGQNAKRKPVSELFLEIAKSSGLLADVRQRSEFEQQEEFRYLQQFFERLKRFELTNDEGTLNRFLMEFQHEREAGEAGVLSVDVEEGPDVVNIMTVHASKGLEFPYVFIVNLVEQKFPAQGRKEAIEIPAALLKDAIEGDHKEVHIAEERRLFYVAMTRAKRGLFLLSADSYGGTRKRKPSRFLSELESEKRQVKKGVATFEERKEVEKPKEASYTLPSRVSFTQLAAFSTCPLQYKFAHILNVPVFGRHSLSFGKTMHNTLQKFMERVFEMQNNTQTSLFENDREITELPSKKELMTMYEENWIDEWYPSQEMREEYMQQGKNSLTAYWDQLSTQKPTIAYIEKAFTLKVGEIVVKGRIDRIDAEADGFVIVDYKTGKPKSKLDWKDRRQLVLYQLAAETCFDPPLKINGLVYHYLEDNSQIRFEAKQKEKEKLEKEIQDTVDAIKVSNFEADGDPIKCSYCDFKDICEFSKA